MSESTRRGWATEQLAEYLALFASFDSERAALPRMVERAAEVLDADHAVLIGEDGLITATGPPNELVDREQLSELAAGRRDGIELPGRGKAHAAAAKVDDGEGRFLILIRAAEPFARDELDLLRGMGRVIGLGLRTLNLVDAERRLREDSDNHAAENSKLLAALRERQVLLERLAGVQRMIVGQHPLAEIFERVIEAGCEITADEVGVLRMRDEATGRTRVAASVGLSQEFLDARRRSGAPGIGDRALAEGRLVTVDKHTDRGHRELPSEWGGEGLRAGMAAPVFLRGEVVGSLGLASRDLNREYTQRDRQVLIALAEHASLALNHARALEEVVHEAFHDSLTELPNRTLLLDRTTHALARAERSGVPVGMLVIDLDDFKTVNDSLGHSAGDALLVQVGTRLAGRLRPSDTIARLGGDEFAVLLDEVADPRDAAAAAERVMEGLAEPLIVADREVFVNASIGIALGTSDAETLLRDADLAMYRAKADGKARYQAYEPRMHTEIVERLELEVDLKRAITQGELALAYQPVFSLRTGAIAGLEALVRWRHPVRGMVPPGRFIPLAESSGRINDLGRWVLAAACHQGALWRAKYPALPGLQVGVNVSAAQLHDPELIDDVASALETARLEPDGLTLEITETALMEDLSAASRRLSELKDLGIEIAVDDFGTGHSSLRYLQRLPLDNLKIAKPFVDEIDAPEPKPPILRAVLDLADVFNLRAVAEGIERPEQGSRLLELGCELGQGHYLSKPLPASEADQLILNVGLLGGPVQPAQPSADPLSPPRSADDPAAAS
jgi:diguanylate cyclase (GGDEF)-like protein